MTTKKFDDDFMTQDGKPPKKGAVVIDLNSEDRHWLAGIRAPIVRATLVEADFDPAKHPRDDRGQFAPSGTSGDDDGSSRVAGVYGADSNVGKRVKHRDGNEGQIVERSLKSITVQWDILKDPQTLPLNMHTMYDLGLLKGDITVKTEADARRSSAIFASTVAGELGFPAERIEVRDGAGPKFKVGDVEWSEGGHFEPTTGAIVLYDRGAFNQGDDAARGMIAHEIQHARFHEVMEQVIRERATFNDDRPAQGPSGYPNDDGAKKYPTMVAIDKYIDAQRDTLIKDDGVSPYSKSYWDRFEKEYRTSGGAPSWMLRSAINETLSEIANQHAETGVIPGTKVWRDFYKELNRQHARVKKSKSA